LSNIAKRRFKNLQKCEICPPYAIDFANFFPTCPSNVATINKLAFNPQLDITQFGVDHIWSLHIHRPNDEVFKLINESAKGLKSLKTLKVSKLAQLNSLVGIDALLELSVNHVSGRELKEYDLSNIAKRFKNLQKCDIEVYVYHDDNLIQPEEYAQIVQDVFQNSATRVEIVLFKYNSSTYLTKEPFQRCVVKKGNSDDSDLDSDDPDSDY